MNYKLRITIILVLIFNISQAQSKLISGKVIVDNTDNSTELNTISVVNNSSGAKTKTNLQGFFSIKVDLNENLEFNGFGLEKRELKIIQQIIDKGYLEVHMNEEIINLNEVNLLTLDKNLKNNIKIKKNSIDILYDNLNLGIDPSLRFRKIDINKTSQVLGGLDPISKFIGWINGSEKNAKKTYKYFKYIEKIEKIEKYFTKNYFIKKLKISEYKIEEFIKYCFIKNKLEEYVNENNFEYIEEVLIKESINYNLLYR
ncbi:hypothetical protein [Empedobacter sp.]|uniref:hypothetical protein n=1 Tax=Empedobacter sp. TaxID=1927715 RepID=UPI002896B159|nr:hypothetical protein [Empedobacter sp.]